MPRARLSPIAPLALLVTTLSLSPSGRSQSADPVYLDTLEPLEAYVSFDKLWTSQKRPQGDVIEVDGAPAKHFLKAHANSRLVYQIPGGARRFQAVGVATNRFRNNSSWIYEVWADGVLLFRSRPLRQYDDRQLKIDVDLPAGAKRLMLLVDNHGSSAEDHSVWAEPCFVFRGSAGTATSGASRNLVTQLPSAQLDGVVLIEGDHSVGTGFLARIRDQPFIVTNQHVLAGNKSIRASNRTGLRPTITGYVFAKDRDLALLRIDADPATLPLIKIADSATSAEVGAELLIAGNSEGGGTVLQSEGRVVGFGPDRLEHDIATVSGNSGSPIFAQASWEVVAIDTYARVRRASASTDPASRTSIGSSLADIRHFGVRIDSAKEWVGINWETWQKDCAELDGIEHRIEGIEKFLTEERAIWVTYPDIAQRVQGFEERIRGVAADSVGFRREASALFQGLLTYAQSQQRSAAQLRDRNIGHLQERADNLASYAGQLEAALRRWDVSIADLLKTVAK
jgi:S1-C subfamily serine protease